MTYQTKSQAISSICDMADAYGAQSILAAVLCAMEGDQVREMLEFLKEEDEGGAFYDVSECC